MPILAVVLVLVGAFFLVDPLAIFSSPVEIPTHTFLRAGQDVDTYSILTADMIEKCQQSAEGVECTPAELDENSVFITRKAIVQGEELDRDAYTVVGGDDGWRPGRMDLEVISFRAEIDKILGGTLRPGHKINIYGFRTDSEEDGLPRTTLIADHVWVVDARTSTGGEVEARAAEEGDGGTGGLFGAGGLAQAGSGPASIVTVAVEPEIALQIIEALGAQQYQAWVTLSGPTPGPTTTTEEPTPTPAGPMPDLVVEDVTTGPFPMVVGQPGTVQVKVRNQGSAEMVTTCWVGLYIDRAAEADPGKNMFCPPLMVGESAVISYTVTLADVGYHALTAWADWQEAIPEEDETNNQYSVSIHWSEPTTPTPTPTPPTPAPTPASPTPTPMETTAPTPMETTTPAATPLETTTPPTATPTPVIHTIFENTYQCNWYADIVDILCDDGVCPVSEVSAEDIRRAGEYRLDFLHTREVTLTVKNVYPPGEDIWIVRTNVDERAEVLIEGHAEDEEGRQLFEPGEEGKVVIRLVEGAAEATVTLLDGVAEAEVQDRLSADVVGTANCQPQRMD